MFIDDPNQKALGEYAYDYIFHGDLTLLRHTDRYYGVFFELLLTHIARVLKLTTNREIYFLRHLGVFLAFYSGLLCFYFLVKKITRDWKWGLLGSLFLLISPRIFENAFYNSKDIPVMVVSILSVYTLINFHEKRSLRTLLIHSLVSGLLIALRIVGLYILVITILLLLIKFLVNRINRHDTLSYMLYAGCYLLFSYLIIVLFWPYRTSARQSSV